MDQNGDKKRWTARFFIPLRLTILSLLLLTISALSAVLIFTWWRHSNRSANDLSEQFLDRISLHVVDQTTSYLMPAASMARLCRGLDRSQVVKTEETPRLERMFIELLRVHPQLAMLNYGNEKGDFIMVKRHPVSVRVKGFPAAKDASGEVKAGAQLRLEVFPKIDIRTAELVRYLRDLPGPLLSAPKPFEVMKGSLSTKIVRRSDHQISFFKHRDLRGVTRSLELLGRPDYEHRSRVWYRLAKKNRALQWSPVYLFFTDKKPGISATIPVLDERGAFKGAVAVEIELKKLSEFLSGIKVGRSGLLFILNARKQIVAYSKPSRLRLQKKAAGHGKNDQGEWVLRNVSQAHDKQVARAFSELGRRTSLLPPASRVILSFRHGGRSYRAMFVPFPKGVGKRWTVGIVVPEDDFLGHIKKSQRTSIVIAFAAVLATILLAFFLSRQISGPLGAVVAETRRIRDLNLEGILDVKSHIREVQTMVASMDRMKTSLRSFTKYVPRELVRRLVATGQEARLAGERRSCTILFTDIAGFTTLSERLPPEDLVSHLSEYFQKTAQVLLAHKATIDKYIGDSIMAFWNAPADVTDHAKAGCRAALALKKTLDDLNTRWADEDRAMHTRIGLHTGEVIVGNIGSEERLNYTIIGDSVNLASRIEGVNKLYGTWNLISEETYIRAKESFTARVVDMVAVKGRKEGVRLFELRCTVEECSEQEQRFQELCRKAMDSYVSRGFAEAVRLWEEAIAVIGGEDRAARVMIARCRELEKKPPPSDWTGTYIAQSK